MDGYEKGGRHWVRGKVVSRTVDEVVVEKDHYSVRNIPWKQKDGLCIGDDITLYFDTKSKYLATSMMNHSLKYIREPTKEKEVKEVKIEKTFENIIEEFAPYMGQEILDKLSANERKELRNLLDSSMEHAIRIVNITATYEDTKREPEAIADDIIKLALGITVALDGHTTQIIKRNLKVEPKEEKV